MNKNTDEMISTPLGEAFDKTQAMDAVRARLETAGLKVIGRGIPEPRETGETRAETLFNRYNETGPNPWKTFDGRDVPRWPEINEQVRAKWTAVAAEPGAPEPRAERAERDHLAAIRQTAAVHLDRAEAAHVQTALINASALAVELREFLGHFAGDKRAALHQLITETTSALADLNRKIAGQLVTDLAMSVPSRTR